MRADGGVQRIVHAIEPNILDQVPGARATYGSRSELLSCVRAACHGLTTVAVNYSATIPALSLVDHGAVEMVQQLAVPTASAADLIQRVCWACSTARAAPRTCAPRPRSGQPWTRRGGGWPRACAPAAPSPRGRCGTGWPPGCRRGGLVSDEPPLVAVARNSGDPHYQPEGAGAPITPDQVLQFDLWAKEPGAHGVYADISWVAFTGTEVPAALQATFAAVCAARDGAVALIRSRLHAREPVTGAEVDQRARAILQRHGLLSAVRHRTGHAIDTQLHGIGVNLDMVEFPDTRPLLDGSCFSIEPGVYHADYGMRSEINALVAGTELVISGGAPQTAILAVAPEA